MIYPKEITEVARQLGRAAKAEKIILFGSQSRREANPESDIDLLIIAESSLPRHKRSRELYQLIQSYLFPLDLLAYTPAEVEKGRRAPFSFISTVLNEGKVVYVRGD